MIEINDMSHKPKKNESEAMEIKELRARIDGIVCDSSMSVDDRLEAILCLADDDEERDPDESDILIYTSVIEILKEECLKDINDHNRLRTLFQFYVLLAEVYDEMEDYRPMAKLAADLLYLMRYGIVPAEIYSETIPRFTSALGNSVYNHALYEVLLLYVRAVVRENPEDDSLKPLAKKLLKLHILLDETDRRDNLWDKDLEKAISSLFTAEELVQIIVNPKIGHLKRDPVEYTRRWEDIFYDVEAETDRHFANFPRQRGLCFRIWNFKRDLLREKYGIEWHSPSQMNPRVRFD